jgi:hypothetical protein
LKLPFRLSVGALSQFFPKQFIEQVMAYPDNLAGNLPSF